MPLKFDEVVKPILKGNVYVNLLQWHQTLRDSQRHKPSTLQCANCFMQTRGMIKVLGCNICEFCQLRLDIQLGVIKIEGMQNEYQQRIITEDKRQSEEKAKAAATTS